MLQTMDNPHDKTSVEHFLTHGAFTIAAVRADPDTHGLEIPFATVHGQLKTKWRALEDLDETVEEHEAVIVVRDRAADKVVRSFELRLLDVVGKNRDDPRYRRYFPDGLRAVTEADARAVEPKLVQDLIQTLEQDKVKPDFATLHADYQAKLQTALEAVQAADRACTHVETQWTFDRDKVLAELKVQWIEERKKLHADLSKKFPQDAPRVESYFRRFAKARKKKEE